PPALSPRRPWDFPPGRDGALSAGWTPHQTPHRRSTFPQTTASSDVRYGAEAPRCCLRLALPWWMWSILRGAKPQVKGYFAIPRPIPRLSTVIPRFPGLPHNDATG